MILDSSFIRASVSLILLLLCFYSPESWSGSEIPKVKQGKLDLSRWDFTEQGPAVLDGNWEFYWSRLYSPHDLKELEPVPDYISVPGLWSKTRIGEIELGPEGVATYRVRIQLPSNQMPLGLRMSEMPWGYQIWLNGRLALKQRRAGLDADKSEPSPQG